MGPGTEPSIDQLVRRIAELEALLLENGLDPGHRFERATDSEPATTAELLNRVGPVLTRELDLQKLVQSVTDIATELINAEFGSFFHNIINERGESYMLYTLSGVSKEAFSAFPMPRNTAVFAPTFNGEGIVRSGDITKDPRYGKNEPHYGMPKGHLPVRSYLAAPVISRSGEVLGGLFFGHSAPERFSEQHEAIIKGIAGQAAIAVDNARLFEQARWAQQELRRSNDELRRANRDLETFAYSASHDLQEPLRNIAISAQLLQRSCIHTLDKEQTQFLESILDGTRHMETLVGDLLTYTRAIRYADGPVPNIPVADVLAGVLHALQARIRESGAKVTFAALPVVAMHEIHLTQLLQNLISNALKYCRWETPCVHVSASQDDGWTVLSVADNGIGIDSKYADQVFGLFKRLHTRAEYPGSGVGLAICQRIIDQYGGRIWVEKSIVGEGSTFSFAIPDTRS